MPSSYYPGPRVEKKLTADKHVLAELPLVHFVIINLTRLTVGVCMKVRFKLSHAEKNQEKPLGPG